MCYDLQILQLHQKLFPVHTVTCPSVGPDDEFIRIINELTLLRALAAAHAVGVRESVSLQTFLDAEATLPGFPVTFKFGLIFQIPAGVFTVSLNWTVRRRSFSYVLKHTQGLGQSAINHSVWRCRRKFIQHTAT